MFWISKGVGMIFVDVTGACLLPIQSGIPRTTRELYRKMAEKSAEVRPLVWQPFYFGYTGLSARSRRLLEDPFSCAALREKPPRDSTIPLLWASLKDLIHFPKRLGLKRILGKGDTLLLTSLFPDNRLIYFWCLLRHPARKVAIFHDAIPLRDPNVVFWEKRLHRATLRVLAGMDLVLCVSKSSEKELQGLWTKEGIPASVTKVLAWPVPFSRERPGFRAPTREGKKVLYVARLKRVKNHATLFKACEILWQKKINFSLELVGCEDVAEESREILSNISILQKRGFPVLWRGQVGEEDLHKAYQNATFTVFPSLMEGFGLPIVESFWHGRPVVCGDTGAMREVSEGEGTVSVAVESAEALAAGMERLLVDDERCLELAKAAYARPVRTWEQYWEELEPLVS